MGLIDLILGVAEFLGRLFLWGVKHTFRLITKAIRAAKRQRWDM